MSDKKSVYQREAYTALSLLGDFGGFTDALKLIVGVFTSFYGARMYQAAIASELPSRSIHSPKFFNNSPFVSPQDYEQLVRGIERGEQLTPKDLNLI